MWRQLVIDSEYLQRVRRATLGALLRANAFVFGVFALVVLGSSVLALTGGDWTFPVVGLVMLVLLPVMIGRAATRSAPRAPTGTYVAYAVTPDGTLHTSGAQGTSTINPGFVARVAATPDCWLIALASGLLLVVPRELIPDADAALLIRHLPGRYAPPPPALRRAV